MAYTVNNSQGAVVATVAENTFDTTTSLTLIGQNKSNFGEKFNENMIFLLENFANSSAPTNAVTGQLWWDTVAKLLKVNTSATSTPTWKVVGQPTSSAAAPTSPTPITGDFWYDTTNKQLKVYSGTGWDLVGPDYTSTQGLSGQKVNTLSDGVANHVVVEFWVGGTLVAIFSKDSTFTPVPAITGFTSISPGFSYSSSVSGVTAGNASTLNGLSSSQFLRSDIATTNSNTTASTSTTTGALVVTGGVGIGDNLYVSANIVAGNLTVNSVNVLNAVSVVSAQIATNSANMTSIDTKLSNAVSAVSAQLTSVKNNLQSAINTVSAQVSSLVAGNLSLGAVASNIIPTTSNTYVIGNTTNRWSNVWAGNFYGTASSAAYADLAEKFVPDSDYPEGTIVMVGGEKEITACQSESKAIGAISLKPAYGMNNDLENGVFVALKGRVPVRVVGPVAKGTELVPFTDGRAQALGHFGGKVFGVALETNTDAGEKIIEALIL